MRLRYLFNKTDNKPCKSDNHTTKEVLKRKIHLRLEANNELAEVNEN